jgi:CHASE2 domain-containing sensor protein
MGIIDWLLRPLGWLFARHPDWRDAFGRWLLKLGARYYWLLALVFAVVGSWNIFAHPVETELARESFDLLMRQRPIAYRADPAVMVLDIDEASLAAMNAQYGRWPWPRQVLAKVAEKIEQAGARAVIFDILFADEDISNSDSEIAFEHYVHESRNSFFPAVRLNPGNDAVSQISLSLLNFARPDPHHPGQADGKRTVAMMTPYFRSIYESTRVGTSNIYPDGDNVVRWYNAYEPLAGYRIPSLPYRVAEVLGWPLPERARSLINWPKGTAPYATFGFARALQAAQSADQDYFKQFAGKVVVVGSTAPNLNDIKATPLSARYPGIYVLATVVDNVKNGAFLHPLNPWLVWALELLMLVGSALLFSCTNQALTVAKYFFIVPAALLGISLLSVSLSKVLIDLSLPAALVLAYFTLAKLFDAAVRDFIAGTGPFHANRRETEGVLEIAFLPKSKPREEVLELLREASSPIKLWEPDASQGFGARWASQGWVLWRWRRRAASAGEDELQWKEVPAAEVSGFALAEAMANSANSGREKK